ncbi:hypothetical protein D3P08_20865 [Paenibacillus nanensis]|uniref:Uncharacterized protein n=1 Tax=Paenibacillus nanensis TaxID=393251 RepID=A0A3A1UPM2_9BACL|nr:hypothetical protein [Paenibacillus nanensis]RIX50304.1 hypothetical protein D3P08_20865 [Paenibacillus nanensis]
MDYWICNGTPLLLNYLVYLSNILHNRRGAEVKLFPYGSMEEAIFWDEASIRQAWAISLAKYAEGDSAGEVDSVLQSNQTIHETLFPGSIEKDSKVLQSFLAWWWSYPCGGKNALEMMSAPLIPVLGDEIRALIKEKHSNKSIQMTIQFLYNPISDASLSLRGDGYVIVPLIELSGGKGKIRQLAFDIVNGIN